MPDRDYYAILGVERSCSQEELAQAFRRLARQYHPDMNHDDSEASARFKEINEAYQTLSDPEQRAQYDMELANPQAGWPAAPSSDEPIVVQRSVVIRSDEVDGAIRELSNALGSTASLVADELRGALRDFAAQVDQIARDAQNAQGNQFRRQGFPPRGGRPPRGGKPPNGPPPGGGKPPRR
jgi:curved DNA-binding protein CbpA